MHETIEVDPTTEDQMMVWTGRGSVASVRGIGPAVGDRWLYYLVEIRAGSDTGEPRPVGSVITALVAASHPACQCALDVVASGRECTWRVEHRRLPHLPPDRPNTDLEEGADTVALLVELHHAPPLSLAMHLNHAMAGDDL